MSQQLIAFLNKMGSTHSGSIRLSSGDMEADWESHHVQDSCDWRLDRQVFLELENRLEPFSIDLFASRTNTQLDLYCSWRPDPYAVAVDALSIPWTEHFTSSLPLH